MSGTGSVLLGVSLAMMPLTIDRHAKPISALITARWVDTAPLGSPVVPEV